MFSLFPSTHTHTHTHTQDVLQVANVDIVIGTVTSVAQLNNQVCMIHGCVP